MHPLGQIFRDVAPAVDISANMRTDRTWEWVCASLVAKENGGCAGHIIDTVFIENQQIWSWYYSSSGGIIRKKTHRKLTSECVQQEFLKLAQRYINGDIGITNDGQRPQYVAICEFDGQNRMMQFFNAHELATCLQSLTTSNGRACISAFVPPRGELDPMRYANLEYELIFNKNGRLQGKLFRLAMGGQKIVSMDSKLNSSVNDQVQHYMSFVEKSRKCRVVYCVTLFVLDDFGHLFLWKTVRCETVPVHETFSHLNVPSTIYEGPNAVNERLLARAKAEAFRTPDEKVIDAILASPTPLQKKATLLRSSASHPRLGHINGGGGESNFDHFKEQRISQLRNARDLDEALQFLPASSTLSRGRRRALSAAHLISSQKKGCCGDYCHVSIHQLSSKRLENNTIPLASDSLNKSNKMMHGRQSSVFTATAAANAFMDTHGRDEDLFQGHNRELSPSKRNLVSPQKQQQEERAQSSHQQHTIPFKLIAQTRAEKQLVDLFVRRYQNGEDGDYLAEEYYGEGDPLGSTFPGYYYQEVQVCSNCFELYTLIEKVRMKALIRLGKKRKGKESDLLKMNHIENPDSINTKKPNRSQLRLHEASISGEDGWEEQTTGCLENPNDQRIWKSVWLHTAAILSNISKKDTAELYSFVNPHPAIAMVLSALGILLLPNGKYSDWNELKRSVSQEKLLLILQKFDLEQLTLDAVMKAAAHARNPLFAPIHISPVSSCAARFCDWILTVLQSYAWKQHRLFKDQDTNRILRFLKPELLPPELQVDDKHTELPFSEVSTPHIRSDRNTSNDASTTSTTRRRKRHQQEVARRALQEQQMARLSAPAGLTDIIVQDGTESIFTCEDGITQIPYTITGQAAGETTKCNLVVFNDMFDTMESTKVFFKSIVGRNIGARALFFNYPGQAGTTYPASESTSTSASSEKTVLNNVWLARKIRELLNFLQQNKRFITSGMPFHIVGFGNGANVAACYTILYGKAYEGYLQSLMLINGFAKVDAQLAAILHSAVNVFTCFPPSRPDLPVTFFSKFLFSDAYLAKVDSNLALSIYTAVTNAITLEGRIRICQGALYHMDLAPQVGEIKVPLILVQSVENALVAPTNVDPFLQGRCNILHAWSHQQPQNGEIHTKTRKQLAQVLKTPNSAFVSWLRSGHEVRQESKQYISELLDLLVCSKELLDESIDSRGSIPSPRLNTVEPTPRKSSTRKAPPEQQINFTKRTIDANVQVSSVLPERDDAHHARDRDALVHALREVDNTIRAQPDTIVPPSTKKSAYELQLERSEQAFQEAIKTHEAQKAEYSKKRWLHEQQKIKQKHQQDLQSFPGALVASSPTLDQSNGNKLVKTEQQLSLSFPTVVHPSIPEVVTNTNDIINGSELQQVFGNHPQNLQAEMDNVKAKMLAEEQRLAQEAEALRQRQRQVTEERMEALRKEQERRRQQWEEEDKARLAALEKQMEDQQAERLAANKASELEVLVKDMISVSALDTMNGLFPSSPNSAISIPTIPRQASVELIPSVGSLIAPTVEEMRQQIRQNPDLPSMFDQLEAEEKAKKRIGLLRVDQFDEIKHSMQQSFSEGMRNRENFLKKELIKRKHMQVIRIQQCIRRYLAIKKVTKLRKQRQQEQITRIAGGEIVRIVRGFLGRRRFQRHRRDYHETKRRHQSAITIQRLFRGFTCRVQFVAKLRAKKVLMIQRVYRGYAGRVYSHELREQQAQRRYMDRNATKLQATWRMFVARDRYLIARFSELAATEIQRIYRGHVGRREAARKKAWRDAEPGPERLALGLKMIEGSKQAFERQQNEIDALHRAQEAVERQVSTIHTELQESEKELAVLERELQEIDQLESDLRELTHEAEMLHQGGIDGLLRSSSSNKQSMPLANGIPPQSSDTSSIPYEVGVEDLFETKESIKKRQADAYAVEMAIQIKRAEREKKRKDLEAEFTSVFGEVQQKRQELAEMEEKLADMEATRMRKDREFARLQRNLMELLEEQKLELENLREKGIELETATATSAAAAMATAMKAKEHEKRSQAMFESTEELMKFQFMSMSLSYFSSLNMLKNLRDINADTTAASITTTAETAAVAAAAAAAANIPAMKRLQVGGADLMIAASQSKKDELAKKLKEEDEAKKVSQQALPSEVREWTVDDVGRWLDSLSLSQYKPAFQEGAVDGEFLLELRPEDMSEVLGVTHKLHVRKIVVARNKLLPLSQQEQLQIDAVNHEANAANNRQQIGIPDLDTVFSQARNGRIKRLTESIEAGFDINSEDDKGNTLLLIACQNVNMKMVEYLVSKRANINHKNTQGNTPLHFAMAYDTEGTLGEYLIGHGADDTIENVFGLTPYDGLTPE